MRHHRRYGVGLPITAAVGALLLGGCESTASPDRAAPRPGPPRSAGQGGTASDPGTLTLAFAGDVHFEGRLADGVTRPESTLGPMSRVLRAADLSVVNLESAVTAGGTRAAKELEDPDDRYWFRSPPAVLDLMDRSGVDVVTVANNHGADYGVPGLRDTLRAAAGSPVAVLGVGRDARRAFRPHRVTIDGTDVAVLAADASPRESVDATWAVGPGSGPGLASARSAAAPQLVAAVRAAAVRDDLVVVYLHWGEEYGGCPTGLQRDLAETLAQAGADVVVGSHSHVLLGAGMLGDTYVGYGLGNFAWYHGRSSETGVLRLTVRGGEVVRDEWLPARIPVEGGVPRPVVGAARGEAVSDWRRGRACTGLAPGPGAAAGEAAGEEVAGDDDGSDGSGALPAYAATVGRLGPALRRSMVRSGVHDPGICPVPLADLRRLAVPYVGFDGQAHRGSLVVHADVAGDVVSAFGSLYAARFPVRRMRLVDAYDGDDDRSMAADNTSAYNCRRVAGRSGWSDHAYGRAVDINPVENPYLVGDEVQPPAGRRFRSVDRTAGAATAPGVIRAGDVVGRAFGRLGWTWGGSWTDPDFQHFSAR